MLASKASKELKKLADPKKAKLSKAFFKTGKGEYAEKDLFIGLTLPQIRSVAKKFEDLKISEIQKLIRSKIHEERLFALVILVNRFKNSDEAERKKIFNFYCKNTKYINNWDLVDISAHQIIGEYLFNKSRKFLYKLIKSKILWERRIALVSTFHFITQGEYQDIIKLSQLALGDKQDLIHKASGWMLRELGKRVDEKHLIKFLDGFGKQMPRTMLRYAIERLNPKQKKKYMAK